MAGIIVRLAIPPRRRRIPSLASQGQRYPGLCHPVPARRQSPRQCRLLEALRLQAAVLPALGCASWRRPAGPGDGFTPNPTGQDVFGSDSQLSIPKQLRCGEFATSLNRLFTAGSHLSAGAGHGFAGTVRAGQGVSLPRLFGS